MGGHSAIENGFEARGGKTCIQISVPGRSLISFISPRTSVTFNIAQSHKNGAFILTNASWVIMNAVLN